MLASDRADGRASSHAASQRVSGISASSVGVELDGATPRYVGTEPSTMTVEHRSGGAVLVTITPR